MSEIFTHNNNIRVINILGTYILNMFKLSVFVFEWLNKKGNCIIWQSKFIIYF